MNKFEKTIVNTMTEDILKIFHISVPIEDINAVVKQLGGTVVQGSSSSVQRNGDGFKIIVRPFKDENQRKFAIANELGHLFLHMGYKIDDRIWNKQKDKTDYRVNHVSEEWVANEFESAFLMPKTKYKEIMDQYTLDTYVDTKKIADYFGVSVSAASSRGQSLGYLQYFPFLESDNEVEEDFLL